METKYIFLDDKKIERKQKIYAALTILIPILVTIFTVININEYLQFFTLNVILFTLFYLLTTLGVSVGYHRLFAHKSYRPNRLTKIILAIMGSMSAQGPVIFWVATHRRHHTFSDKEGDVHSPNLSKNKLMGFFFAHVGWMLKSKVTNPVRFCKDLLKDQDILILNKYYFVIVGAGIIVPGIISYSVYGNSHSFVEGVIWGGFIRMFAAHHITWALNSFAHLVGKQNYKTGDFSNNIAFLSVISMGESWHNNHHAFPNSALFGVDKGQLDPGFWFIKLLARIGVADSIKLPKNKPAESIN